jgi:large subunit ribosomal protein L29
MAKKDKDFDYKEVNEQELTTRLEKTQQELFKLRFRAASAPLTNTMQIRTLRREIARLNTFINQKTAPAKTPVSNLKTVNKRGNP